MAGYLQISNKLCNKDKFSGGRGVKRLGGEAFFDMVLIIRITEGDVPYGRMCFLFLLKARTRRLVCHTCRSHCINKDAYMKYSEMQNPFMFDL